MGLFLGIAAVVFAQDPAAPKSEIAKPEQKPAAAVTATPLVTKVSTEAVRGGQAEVTIVNAPAQAITARLQSLEPQKPDPKTEQPLKLYSIPGETTAAKVFKVDIPTYLALGRYAMSVNAGDTAIPATGTMLIDVVLGTEPKISNAFPVPAAYPEDDDTFNVTVVGEGFSHLATDNHLLIDGEPVPGITNEPAADGRSIVFQKIPLEYNGRRKVTVHVGNRAVAAPVDVTFSWVKRRTPRRVAIFITFALLVFILVLARRGRKAIAPANRPSLFASFFYDEQTKTYSVSMAQFYLWTFAAIFGWLYLTAALSLVQGSFEFAPVPENLPGILLISAGTAVVATGVGSDKTKGAGAPDAGMRDFITTGGMVVPERVQFVVWTIVGVLAFLFLIGTSDPGAIKNLPKIPEGFLYLMGISSAGYLGGKLARQPGPIISSVAATFNSPLTITVVGRNLSRDARLTLDDVEVDANWLMEVEGKHLPEVLAREDDQHFARELRFVLPNVEQTDGKYVLAPDKKVGAPFRLALINPDGQRAEKDVTVTTPT
jgi:hypothetical protein